MSKRAEIVYHYDGDVPGLVCWREECNDGHLIVTEDGRCVETLGGDGGEPEDQRLCRDWSWVQALAQRALDAEAERDRLAADLDALAGARECPACSGYGHRRLDDGSRAGCPDCPAGRTISEILAENAALREAAAAVLATMERTDDGFWVLSRRADDADKRRALDALAAVVRPERWGLP